MRSKEPNETSPMSDRSGTLTSEVGQLGHRQAPAAGIDAVVGELRSDVPDRLDDDRDDRAGDETDEDAALHLARDEDAGQQQAEDEDQRRHGGDRAVDAEADGRRRRCRSR